MSLNFDNKYSRGGIVEKTEHKWLALFVGVPLIIVLIGYFVYFGLLYKDYQSNVESLLTELEGMDHFGRESACYPIK